MQIVLREKIKMHEGRNKKCEGEIKDHREKLKGSTAKVENKRLKRNRLGR